MTWTRLCEQNFVVSAIRSMGSDTCQNSTSFFGCQIGENTSIELYGALNMHSLTTHIIRGRCGIVVRVDCNVHRTGEPEILNIFIVSWTEYICFFCILFCEINKGPLQLELIWILRIFKVCLSNSCNTLSIEYAVEKDLIGYNWIFQYIRTIFVIGFHLWWRNLFARC